MIRTNCRGEAQSPRRPRCPGRKARSLSTGTPFWSEREIRIDDLLGQALRVRYTLLIRNLLGRLAWSEAKEIVPPAVWRLLEIEDEADGYRRMAELLDHLGLHEALQELCARAGESLDEEVREVAEDFGEERLEACRSGSC